MPFLRVVVFVLDAFVWTLILVFAVEMLRESYTPRYQHDGTPIPTGASIWEVGLLLLPILRGIGAWLLW